MMMMTKQDQSFPSSDVQPPAQYDPAYSVGNLESVHWLPAPHPLTVFPNSYSAPFQPSPNFDLSYLNGSPGNSGYSFSATELPSPSYPGAGYLSPTSPPVKVSKTVKSESSTADMSPTTRKGGKIQRFKTPSPALIRTRRIAANARERKRMNSLNYAFDKLRGVLPNMETGRKSSKVETLALAQEYIKCLSKILNE